MSWKSEGSELNEGTLSTRALGMGNAYLGLARNMDALFYNPAGLANNSIFRVTLLNVGGGVNDIDALTGLQDLTNGDNLSETLDDYYGENLWVGGGGRAGVAIPFAAFAVYDTANVSMRVNNPVYSSIDVNAINDYGYVGGFGVPLGPFLQVGMNFRRVKRTGNITTLGAEVLSTLNTDDILAELTRWGVGYGLDYGMNIRIPGPVSFVLSTVYRNIGVISFTSPNVNANERIPVDRDEIAAGLALDIDLPLISIRPAIDFRFLNYTEEQTGKKLNLGVEVSLPLIDLRAGFHQGYYTYGAGINLGFLRVDAASYGVELGTYPGQTEDRRFMIEAALEIGFDSASDSRSGSGKKGGRAGGSSSSSSSKSWWSKGLKVRR